MEIFMRNIDYSMSFYEVKAHLAVILHSARYARLSPLPLMNFHVQLFKDNRGGRPHSGKGALTLPTEEVGNYFLGEYGDLPLSTSTSCNIGQRRVRFTKSRRPARPDVLESIQWHPYVDPKAMEEKEKRKQALDPETVSIKTIQFGQECRDSVFSIEWEETFPQLCHLSFDDDRRELRLKITQLPHTYIIAMRFSQINSISTHTYLSEEHIIFLSLDTPPSFEREMPTSNSRQRLSALPVANHARVAPYTSLAMRLICDSQFDIAKFCRLGKIAQLHDIGNWELTAEHRGLFSVSALSEYEGYLRKLNWCVSFQLEGLLRNMYVNTQEILRLMPKIQRLVQTQGKRYTALMLRHFGTRAAQFYWSPDEMEEKNIEQCFDLAERDFKAVGNAYILQPTDGSLFEALHIIVTPTTMFFEGPFVERSNRIIRQYNPTDHDSFIRVTFLEEDRLRYRFDREMDGPAFIRSRVGDLLLNGLTIARRNFQFLAYSQSALKGHSVWFVKSFRNTKHGYVNAPAIIKSIGSFDRLEFDPELVYYPARYAARLAQAFTATDASVSVAVEEIFPLRDIYDNSKKYCFTDGVGTMSLELAIEISQELRTKRHSTRHKRAHPRAFQIRFMGSKGMLSVDHRLKGRAICLRSSMIKFEAPESREIEIARSFDRPGGYFLNRPLIMILEDLGVPYEVFKSYQDRAVEETQSATESLARAARMLESNGLGTSYRLTSVMLGLEKIGVDNLYGSAFYQRMLGFAIFHVLRLLKNNARIPIPDAYTLVGVADIHKLLKEGEIFACVKPVDGGNIYLEGPILISRSPTIHPGDVQIVHAIGRPPTGSCFSTEPLPNTVVFSVVGNRPLPSCLGGGDLDGDVYNLIPLNKFPEFRPQRTYPPAEYSPAPKKRIDHPSTMEDVAEFVMEYINSDVVGIIAINWLIIADQSPQGILDRSCLQLSNLHSDAVDYPKSGQPVKLAAIPKLRFKEKPDWSAPETVNQDSAGYYPSSRAIGRLFRDINLPKIPHRKTPTRRRKPTDDESVDGVLAEAFEELNSINEDEDSMQEAVRDHVYQFVYDYESPTEGMFADVQQIYRRYVSELQAICATNTLSHARFYSLTEEEAVVGTIAQKSSQPRKRKDMVGRLREQTDILVRGVREELAGDDDVTLAEALQRSWLAWELSVRERKSFGGESFGWVALGSIFEVIKEIKAEVQDGVY